MLAQAPGIQYITAEPVYYGGVPWSNRENKMHNVTWASSLEK
jgi:hypothetical protein